MPTARCHQVDLAVTPYYHLISRCVRQAFLCGNDRHSGRCFDHRKDWARDRLHHLTQLFAIDVLAYAVMSNHMHIVVRVDEERARAWTEDEVIARHTALFPMSAAALNPAIDPLARSQLIEMWRERLHDLSWLMRALSEYLARKANDEDKAQGRFWEGRFKSQPILDEVGLLACMAYVDLNPLRAGIATTLEGAEHTSIHERITDRERKRSQRRKQTAPVALAAFADQDASGQATVPIPIGYDTYLELLQWTALQVRPGEEVPEDASDEASQRAQALLAQLGFDAHGWLEALSQSRLGKATTLGAPDTLENYAAKRGQAWARGIRLARKLEGRD